MQHVQLSDSLLLASLSVISSRYIHPTFTTIRMIKNKLRKFCLCLGFYVSFATPSWDLYVLPVKFDYRPVVTSVGIWMYLHVCQLSTIKHRPQLPTVGIHILCSSIFAFKNINPKSTYSIYEWLESSSVEKGMYWTKLCNSKRSYLHILLMSILMYGIPA